jgi:hypothetical protein
MNQELSFGHCLPVSGLWTETRKSHVCRTCAALRHWYKNQRGLGFSCPIRSSSSVSEDLLLCGYLFQRCVFQAYFTHVHLAFTFRVMCWTYTSFHKNRKEDMYHLKTSFSMHRNSKEEMEGRKGEKRFNIFIVYNTFES